VRRFAGTALILLASAQAGCDPTYSQGLVDASGEPIPLESVLEVLTDSSLTEEEQRDALRELGITNEQLIEVLIGTD
jgi:hypothetical protein